MPIHHESGLLVKVDAFEEAYSLHLFKQKKNIGYGIQCLADLSALESFPGGIPLSRRQLAMVSIRYLSEDGAA